MSESQVFRDFIGGPCAGECRAVNESSLTISIPLPKQQRQDPDVPEWFAYRLEGEDMVFAGRGTDAFDVLWRARDRSEVT